MAERIESYRGSVKAWECDSFGHFTVAYYFERFAEASAAAIAAFGQRGLVPPATVWRPHAFTARFEQELRAGDGLHILSALLEAQGERLRLGHEVINSASGAAATTVAETLTAGAAPAPPAYEPAKGFMTASLDVVRAAELDERGELTLGGYIHRTSAASAQLLCAAGITAEYLRAEGRGFATFEIRLELHEPRPRAGDRIKVEAALARLGTSSLQMLHRVSDAATGRPLASASQSGAHFDLKTRRSTPLPGALRAKAAAFVVAR